MTSQNVVGRRGATCRAYIGSHYDSVPEGPGANDNASGTASMLEIARVRATDGLCAIAFGSEEIGMNGSQAFVRDHSPKRAAFMVNFDMMGRIERPIVVGDRDLTQRIMGIIKQLPNQPLKPGVFPPFASSDHVSFSSVGVPAVTITAGDDDNMHTPKDNADGIQKADLQTMLNLGDTAVGGLLKALAEGGQPPPEVVPRRGDGYDEYPPLTTEAGTIAVTSAPRHRRDPRRHRLRWERGQGDTQSRYRGDRCPLRDPPAGDRSDRDAHPFRYAHRFDERRAELHRGRR